MITAKNLEKAGFIPGGWEDLDDGDKYRSWQLRIDNNCAIEIDEVVTKGVMHFMSLCLIVEKEYHPLHLTTVTQILELKKLLS